MSRRKLLLVVPLIPVILCAGCSVPRAPKEPGTLRVMTFNIRHAEGTDGKVDVGRIAKIILGSNADLVALQDVDRGVERTNRIDIITRLAELTEMSYAFGRTIEFQGGENGNAVLFRFPLLEERNHHYAPIGPGEERGLLQLVLEIDGHEVVLMNTHLDHREGEAGRIFSVRELRAAAGRYAPRPIIVCGNLNDAPESETIRSMKEDFIDAWDIAGRGSGYTFPSDAPRRRIDYIFIAKPTAHGSASISLRPVAARVLQTDASDHLPLVADFKLLEGSW